MRSMFLFAAALLMSLFLSASQSARACNPALTVGACASAYAQPAAVPAYTPASVQTLTTGIGSTAILVNAVPSFNALSINSFSAAAFVPVPVGAGIGGGSAAAVIEERRGLFGRVRSRTTAAAAGNSAVATINRGRR